MLNAKRNVKILRKDKIANEARMAKFKGWWQIG